MTPERAWRSAARAWNRIPLAEPWRVLAPLLLVHWIALAIYTTKVHHNAWLFYQGGDQIWYWTTGWLVGQGSVSEPLVAHGWPLLLVPLTWIGGPGFLGALPVAMLFQIVVLAPIALWCMYELGSRIGGRVIGYLAAIVWTLGPYVAVPLFVQSYHDRYVDQFLPHVLGLTAMSDYVGTVFLLGAAVFSFRAVESRDPYTAAMAGLTFGFALLIKPSSVLFLPAPLLLLVFARRWRELGIATAAFAPALLALAIWKYRGYGYVPAFAAGETTSALGTDTMTDVYDKYVSLEWRNLWLNVDNLGQFFWSVRVLQWLPFAGAVAVARRSLPHALFLSAWFWSFLVVKGTSEQATVESGSFLRLLLPAMPAYILLATSLPLLFPKYGIELVRRTPAPPLACVGRRIVIGAAALLCAAPLVAAAAVSPTHGPAEVLQEDGILVPVDGGLDLTAKVAGRQVRLGWNGTSTLGVNVSYKVYRTPAATDTLCTRHDPGADVCVLQAPVLVEATPRTEAVDRPGPGTWTYRIGIRASWLNDGGGDVFLLTKPVTVTTR